MTAYLVVWRCDCSHLADTTDIPSRCPGHDREAIYPNSSTDRHWQQVEPLPGMPRGHQCSDQPWLPACPTVQPDLFEEAP